MLLLAIVFQLNLYICSTSASSIIQDHQTTGNYATRTTNSATTTSTATSLVDHSQWRQRTRMSPRALRITSSIASQFIDANGSNEAHSTQDLTPNSGSPSTSLIRDNKMPTLFNANSETGNYSNSNMITRGDILDGTNGLSNMSPTDEAEMFTNNHQSWANENSVNGQNSRHYDSHHHQFGGSNPGYHNKYVSNSNNNHNNNVYVNNFNLNYIHSLLTKPNSQVSPSTSLLNLYQNNNSPGASSSTSSSHGSAYLSPYISASSALSSAVNNLQQTLANKQQQLASHLTTQSTTPTQDQQHLNHAHHHYNQQYDQASIGDFPGSTMCGRQQVGYREPRIVGGNHTYEGEFPWAVSIQRHGNHHCGGVIVGRRWILTAAHCVRSQLVGNLLIRTGGQTLSRSSNSLNSHMERDYFVEQIVMHDDFSRYDNLTASQMKSSANTNNADIALLKLKHDIHWNELVWPVCFPNKRAGNFSGHDAIVIGWGKLNEKSEDFSNDLQKVKLTIIDNKVCQNWFRQAGREMPIDERIICAGFKNGGKDACHGDSGGPLLSRINGQYVVVGVVSTGIGCARPLLPGLYSRVSSYIGWIEKYVID